jgi:arylsulfatase I/J
MIRNCLPIQHGVIKPFEPKFLPEQFEILPQKLKNLGYSTHIIGKYVKYIYLYI